MITGKYKDFDVVFLNDPNDLNIIYSSFSLLKKDGTLYKTVSVNKDYYFESPLGKTIICTLIKYKNSKILVFKDSYTFNLELNKFTDYLDSFGFKYNLSFDGKLIHGPVTKIDSNLFKDADGNNISFAINKEEVKGLDSFIMRMRKDNGHIISPLVKRFGRTAFLVRDSRYIIGYAHLPTYLKILKHGFDEKFLVDQNFDSRADLLVTVDSNSASGSVIVNDFYDDTIEIKLNIDGSHIGLPNNKKSRDPYILLGSRPININGNKIPFFTIMVGKTPVFVSVLLFNDTSYLTSIKGSIDLMKFN